ncbi:MAG: cytochrome c3 family protein, partial [Bacteroidota bacterium]
MIPGNTFRRLLRHLFRVALLVTLPAAGFSQSRSDCQLCHSDPDLSMEKRGREISLFVDETKLDKSPHARLVCVACHAGFNPDEIPHKETIAPINCLTCHTDAVRKHPFHPQMIRASGRNGSSDVSCKQCHGTHEILSPRNSASTWYRTNLTESCGTCHGDVTEQFTASAHGQAVAGGVASAPACITCHQSNVVSIPKGGNRSDLKIVQEKMCLSCHLDDPNVRARTAPSAGFITAYESSVHGRSLLAGNDAAANCVDCHGSHELKKGFDPTSMVHRSHITETCGQCHGDVAMEFGESAHGTALLRGNKDAPVCTSCHGEHNILSHDDPRSPVAPLNVSGQVCSPCHSSLRLSEKYGINANRFETFSDSYHGLAVRAGSVSVANCASCHGAHNIRPSSDPTSMVHKDNLAATCGSCHPGAGERFASGSVHVAITREEEPLLYWISTIYIILIVTVVGGMFGHNALDFYRKARRKILIRRGVLAEEHVGHGLYLRMTLSERLQHGSLALSFIILVITGFMLRYPEAWWVVAIRGLSDSVFDLRGLL